MANRLTNENSRYLRMHADNPVNWYPWGNEAFDRARSEKKPVLVSIGYSSCHWCHVMAHESFEDPDTAAVINKHFIAVKIDKEEYPDVDGFYMEFASRSMGNGGWPLNVFVNHNRMPFYSLTYLPPDKFRRVLTRTAERYGQNGPVSATELEETFSLPSISSEQAFEIVRGMEPYDPYDGNGPRFPMALYFAWCAGFTQHEYARSFVEQFLHDSMTKGLFDHIQGGWFRYTVDPDWKIPHFEKMLYDQAMLLYLCARAYTVNTRLCDYAIRMTTRWLREHMRLPTGLFGSSTDADTDHGEGVYYTIDKPESDAVRSLFRLESAGIHEKRYVPWIDLSYIEENPEASEGIREMYEGVRKAMIPPELDEKVVFSWNAFLGYAFLLCYKRLGEQEYLEFADEIHTGLSQFIIGDRIPHGIYGSRISAVGYEYLADYSSFLLFTAELSKYRSGLSESTDRIIDLIARKFISGGTIFNTTERVFESLSLWQDIPFPSGGSMLAHALLSLESGMFADVESGCSGILAYAENSPEFFPLWLEAYSRSYLH